MASHNFSAPQHALSGVRRSPRGVAHVRAHQPDRYTIIGNHLTQHRVLWLTAIGLGAHIQSLPDGAPVDIRTLAGKFPEGRERIAGALRELEGHGYIERARERTPGGLIITRTISHHAPGPPVPAAGRSPTAATRRYPPQQSPPPPHRPRPRHPVCRPQRRSPPTPPRRARRPASANHAPPPPSRWHPNRGTASPPPPSSPACATRTTGCCCPSGRCAISPRPSPPGWNETRPPTPSAAPSPRTCQPICAIPPPCSPTVSARCCHHRSPQRRTPLPTSRRLLLTACRAPIHSRTATAATAPSAPPDRATAATAERPNQTRPRRHRPRSPHAHV